MMRDSYCNWMHHDYLFEKFLGINNLSINQTINMKALQTFYFLLLCFLFSPIYTQINLQDPVIIKVSTVGGVLSGSIQGGTILIIKGTSFNPDFTKNSVWVGPYPCHMLADGSTETSLSCRTTQAYDPLQYENLPIRISVDGKNQVTCASLNCLYSYMKDQTPFISQIFPKSSTAGLINIYGYHRISDLGDARSHGQGQVEILKIGDQTCSLIDVEQEDEINGNLQQSIYCQVSKRQQAGQYSFTQVVDPGKAEISIRNKQTSYLTGKNYTQRIIPNITELSSHEGGERGHLLKVKGTGFSSDLKDYSCRISGEICTVKKASYDHFSIYIPKKDPGNTEFGKLPKHNLDNQIQQLGYIGGGGVLYERFDRTGIFKDTLDEWLTFMQLGNHSLALQEKKIVTQLNTPQKTGSYIEYLRGYFYAHTGGVYRFSSLADDQLLMKMGTYPGNANKANLETLLYHQALSQHHFIPETTPNLTQSTVNRTLQKGYYYFQLICINYGETGFFKVLMDTPKLTNQGIINPTWQIDKVSIKPSAYTAEEIVVTVNGVSGTFDLFYHQQVSGSWQTYSNTFLVGVSEKNFYLGLRKLPNMRYKRAIKLETYNSAGNLETDQTLIVKYVYTISFESSRPLNSAVPQFNGENIIGNGLMAPSILVERTVQHSAPLSGTIKYFLGGTPLEIIKGNPNFDYNMKTFYIAQSINNILGLSEVSVTYQSSIRQQDQISMIIEYVGLNQSPPPLTFDLSLMNGGAFGSTIEAKIQTLKYYSTRPMYSPIPYDFLFIPSETPGLILEIKQIPALCIDCSYRFDLNKSPIISSYSRTGNIVSLSVNDVANAGLTLQDIDVTILNTHCSSPTGTLSSFTCQLPINIGGSLKLPAGNGKVEVHTKHFGYADNSAVGDQIISLIVNLMSPSKSSPGGLVNAKITGVGFPLDRQSDLNLEICGNQVVNFIEIGNTEISFLIPPQITTCTGSNSIITVNGKNAQINFSYDPNISPTITALSPQSSSPILKSTLIISGSQFGSNSDTSVYLYSQGQQKYKLSIISITNTQIECILGGGKSGEYTVVVIVDSVGASVYNTNSVFQYCIFVDSLSISSGHKGGGYDLTITGENFAEEDSTHVLIGTAINSFCQIKAITSTIINCTIPRMKSEYRVGDSLQIIVTGRIMEESVCRGTCLFSYEDAGTPLINLPQIRQYNSQDQLRITGSGLSGSSVTIGGKPCAISVNIATQIICQYPILPFGSYEVIVTTTTGWIYPEFISSTGLYFSGISDNSGSQNGQILTISGNGFPEEGKLGIWLVCTSISQLDIIQIEPNQISIEIPAFNGNQADRLCKINATSGKQYQVWDYSYSTDKTPSITITDLGTLNYQLTETKVIEQDFDQIWFIFLDTQDNPTSSKYPMVITKINETKTQITPLGGYLPSGKFKIFAHKPMGFAFSSPEIITISFQAPPIINSVITTSFVGGKSITIQGAGFSVIQPQNNDIRVCGLRAEVITASKADITIKLPTLLTEVTQQQYNLRKKDIMKGIPISDTNGKGSEVFDGLYNSVYTSELQECYVGYDFGPNTIADLHQIKFIPNPVWDISSNYLQGAVFEGSSDNATWILIFEIDTSQVHSSWNSWKKSSSNVHKYRYLRFRHNQLSKCSLAEIQMIGFKYSMENVVIGTDKVCDVTIATQNILIPNMIVYSDSVTSTVTAVSPQFGSSFGSETITIAGTNFGASVSVRIDGIQCIVQSQNDSSISCITGLRATPPQAGNSFTVISDGNYAKIVCKPYYYADKWSSQITWGGQAIPRAGDTVYVPKGMTLLVDIDQTPILQTILVEGKILFSDEKDMKINTKYFLIIGGQFQAGTEESPYQHQLLITLHGDIQDKQLPIFGNKVLGCKDCMFNLHGKPRDQTWTQVSSTISAGDKTFSVINSVDWQPGQKIAVASTGFDHQQTEQMIIQSISGTTITVTEPFRYKHYAAIEIYGTQEFPMRAQVGLLTRNIKIMGSEGSSQENYGSHLMMTGRQNLGLISKISYTEFTHCGQPKIIGRYCTHFHMAGDVHNSYVRGISVHHSFARVLTIHGTNFLTVEKNVGYHVQGHNIFIEDGIEIHNTIQDNLMMSSISSLTMLQSDLTVASYWITNPLNTIRRNHAAGGEFYGFWYEIKQHPDGPSATTDICPMGMRLGESRDNVAHSNKRFGLRIFKLSARKYPCKPTQDQSQINPYSSNPAIHSIFENYTLWRNEECGFLGQQLGYTTIRNFKTIDSRKGGLQFHKTNYTQQFVTAENSLVVGVSQGNAPISDLQYLYKNARGIIASRTDGLKFSGIAFHNFKSFMTPLQSCSECWISKLWVTGGKTTYFQNISYNSIDGKYIYWEKWRRQIFIDIDGSLSKPFQQTITPSIPSQTYAAITPKRATLSALDNCYESSNDLWDNSILCDQSIVLRAILFTNAQPTMDLSAIDIKAYLLQDPLQDISSISDSQFSSEPMIIIKLSQDIRNSWAMPFATNKYYNIHWKNGIDFSHLNIAPSRLWNDSDGAVLRFNYTDQRELFEIFKMFKETIQQPSIQPSSQIIDPSTCLNGQYYHHKVDYLDPINQNKQQYLFVCVSGRNKAIRQWIDINGKKCDTECERQEPPSDNETTIKMWSDAKIWPHENLPVEGDNVTVPSDWQLIVDIDPPILNYVKIDGILAFDRNKQTTIFQAYYIWVSQGKIIAGSLQSPFENKINIILHGYKDSQSLVIDNLASGNKMLAVTGGLELYGIQPETVWTRLTKTAKVGESMISVQSLDGWKVNDQIVIAPSYSGPKQYEQVKINSINQAEKTITFQPPLQFEHYGAATTTLQNQYGILDTRSAGGVLSRNIKITGRDASSWGCRVLIYGYLQVSTDATITPKWKNGYAKLKGVEFDGCGQRDTSYAGLRIENLGEGSGNITINSTKVIGSSFHNCGSFCMYMDDNTNISIDNNIFFGARKFLVYVQDVISDYNFTENLLIGAKKREELDLGQTGLIDDVACYEQYFKIDLAADHKVRVNNNLCQGSEGQGFVFPSTQCDYLETYPFVNNTAGSCQVAFMFEKNPGKQCIGARGAIAYASQIGLMSNQPGTQTKLIYEKMFFADNRLGVTLRYAHETDENTCIFRESYISGISRISCPTCYGAGKIEYCAGGYAVRMFAATKTGESFPLLKKPTGHDVICTQQSFDFKAFLQNVTFENYFHENADIPYCSGMSVFKRNTGASDGTASHYLKDTICKNCTKQSWAYFESPNAAWRGWFGGCGQIDCTGPNNYFIYDQDGRFTGEKSQILANNSVIADSQEACQFISSINGHWCHTEKFAILQYQSIAPDFNKRTIWPTYLNYEGGNWTSETNAWKQWEWEGKQPMNLRLGRFWSTIKLHETYNLTYSSEPPQDARYQIQKRQLPDGNPQDWIIIKINFPISNSIQVLVKNTTHRDHIIKPFPIRQGVPEQLAQHTTLCGANNYHYQNGTIEFLVNGASSCQVRVRLSNYIQLSTKIDISIDDFYSNDGPTNFITNICAYLGIDTGRLKIVSISSGSIIINAQIITQDPDIDESKNSTSDPEAEKEQLNKLAQKLRVGTYNKEINLGGDILQFEAQVIEVKQKETVTDAQEDNIDDQQENSNRKTEINYLAISLGIGIPVFLTLAIGSLIYWKRRQSRVSQASPQQKREIIYGTTLINFSTVDDGNQSKKSPSRLEYEGIF